MKLVKIFDDKWLKKPSKKELYDLVEEQRKEIERLNKDLKDACVVIERLKEDKKKAIEYIEYLDNVYIDAKKQDELLEILDKEEQ